MASSNLGALGARDGAPVYYNWALTGLATLLLPWLIVCGLLTLPANRRAAAWLIWLPLGCVLAFTVRPPFALPSGADFLLDAFVALAMGLAAVCLLASYLRRQHGILTFLCVFFALMGFSLLAGAFQAGGAGAAIELIQTGILLAIGVLTTTVALGLGAWINRRRYRPLTLHVWLLLLVVAIWLLIAAPFFLMAVIVSHGQLAWSEFFGPVLAVALANFAVLLPFLILTSASPFFRERLKALLHIKPETPPVLSASGLDAQMQT